MSFGRTIALVSLLAFATLVSCQRDAPTAPTVQPPYLAIVMRLDAPAGFTFDGRLTYRVVAHSEGIQLDTAIAAAPRDTLVLPVKPADYTVAVEGLPGRCDTRTGSLQFVSVFPTDNTAIVRWSVSCRNALRIRIATDGLNRDDAYIVRILDTADRALVVGQLGAADSAVVDPLAAGSYVVQLLNVSPNCVATNDGGERVPVSIPPAGGAIVQFYVRCSDATHRPRVLFFKGSYADGGSGFVARVHDPNRDVDSYYWDITDCRGHSVLPKGGRTRRNLSAAETRGLDTVTITAAFEVGIADAEMAGRCTLLRITDFEGNSTETLEDPIGTSLGGRPPAAASFNARFVTTAVLRTQVIPADADGDFIGVFGAVMLRDGNFGPVDGSPDIAVFNLAGYRDARFPDIAVGSGFPPFGEYLAVIVYLFDARGNMTRLVDQDLMQ